VGDQIRQVVLERAVLIVGANSLQNHLLAKLIGERTGYLCEVCAPDRANGQLPASMLLALLDAGQCGPRLASLCASGMYRNIAVINADAGLEWDHFVGYPGVKGVFCSDVSEEHLIKGIEAIFKGEYWFSRKLLVAHLERTRIAPDAAESPLAGLLTRKEMATLKLLAAGNSTEHIAASLKVSPHTVKTHIYNLFRKIHVTNRVQAAHWAARHLVTAEPVK
jgi:LuxR family transcriptional regulator, positive regulator of biofilm formation